MKRLLKLKSISYTIAFATLIFLQAMDPIGNKKGMARIKALREKF